MNRAFIPLLILCALESLSSALTAHAEAPYNVQWSRQIGTTDLDTNTAVATDALGNAYITGYTYGNIGGPNAGIADGFLSKYDGAGNLLWSRQIGTESLDSCSDVTVDTAGNAYVTGITFGNLNAPNAGLQDFFLAKYDSAGNALWSRQFGTPTYDSGSGLALDAIGNVYIAGITGLDGSDSGLQDAALFKYDSAGNLLWSRQIGTSSEDSATAVAVDVAGNAYITGSTQGSLGGPNAGSDDAFLTKYDSSGTVLWSRQIGTTAEDESRGVAVDAAGNAYIGGPTFGSLAGPNAGSSDAFLTKYDGAGNLLWSRQLGTTSREFSNELAVDSAGNAYITGGTRGNLGGPSAGADDAFLTKYDGAGNLLWSRQIGTSVDDSSQGVALDIAGNVYMSGNTVGSLAAPQAGVADAFLVKLAVPEPSTFALAALGLGLIIVRRRLTHH